MPEEIPGFFSADEFRPPVKKHKKATKKSLAHDASSLADGSCEQCALRDGCKSPKMEPFGDGNMRILIVAEAPGEMEDERNCPLVGKSGQFLSEAMQIVGLGMDADCVRTNVVQCRPPDNRDPSPQEIANCRPRLREQIRDIKPDLILCLGDFAFRAILHPPTRVTVSNANGQVFPCEEWGCYVGVVLHPSGAMRVGFKEPQYATFLHQVMMEFSKRPPIEKALLPEIEIIAPETPRDFDDAIDDLAQAEEINVDFETNQLSPFDKSARIICASFSTPTGRTYFFDSKLPSFKAAAVSVLTNNVPKSCQNANFERGWATQQLGIEISGGVYCTMVAAHILDERRERTSLDYQTFLHFGRSHKGMVDRANIEGTDHKTLMTYNALDAHTACQLHQRQWAVADAGEKEAIEFFNRCLPALHRMRMRGVKIDREKGIRLQKDFEREIEQTQFNIRDHKLVRSYLRKKPDWNPGSSAQLSKFLFQELGITPINGNSVNRAVIEALAAREGGEVAELLNMIEENKRTNKLVGTYIKPFLEHSADDGFIHPGFLLHIPVTYRSSSEDPNFQNVPKRDEKQAVVRSLLIPRHDLLGESDYAAAEVRVLAMYSEDSTLTDYIINDYDMHREWAARIWEIPKEEVTKEQRSRAKNSWVFPLFYGSYYRSVAKSFADLGKPERFFQQLEKEFRHTFRGVMDWQDEMLDRYEGTFEVDCFLGFRRRGPISRNQVINSPVQGTSFHLLLDAAARIDEELMARGMQSMVIGQIHDSIEFDIAKDELGDVCDIAQTMMETKRFDFEGRVPMVAEIELGDNWLHMEAVK